MATRKWVCVVGRTWVSAQKDYNFWCDRWIALKFLQGFPEPLFICVAMEWLLGDENVWSVKLKYRVKRAITFGPIVGSRSNFYSCFQRLFSLGKPWNRWVTRMSSRHPWVSAQKGHNFWSDRLIALKILHGFLEAVFVGVAVESLFSEIDVRPVDRAQIFTGVSRCCFHWGKYGMATRWQGCLAGRTRVSADKGHNFWSDRWITLKFLQRFPEVVLVG